MSIEDEVEKKEALEELCAASAVGGGSANEACAEWNAIEAAVRVPDALVIWNTVQTIVWRVEMEAYHAEREKWKRKRAELRYWRAVRACNSIAFTCRMLPPNQYALAVDAANLEWASAIDAVAEVYDHICTHSLHETVPIA